VVASWLTVSDAEPWLAAAMLVPLKLAMTVCEPTPRAVVVYDTWPLLVCVVYFDVPSTRKVTLPLIGELVPLATTFAVNVTD
jgi:hypothetical protein